MSYEAQLTPQKQESGLLPGSANNGPINSEHSHGKWPLSEMPLVGELACRLDLVGDVPDLSFQDTATGCQVDQHPAFVGPIARYYKARALQSVYQRRDCAGVRGAGCE
jgi:hypothetical protein